MSERDPKLPGVIAIQQIVNEVLNDLNEFNSNNYMRYLQWAVRAFEYVHVSFLKTFEIAYLDINEANVAVLPIDFIEWQNIGIIDSGVFYPIGSNNDNMIPRDESCGEVTEPEHSYHATISSGQYGSVSGIDLTDFRIDKEMGVIRLSSKVTATQIYLEYTSCGISSSGTTYIPREAKEAIIKFIHWQRALFEPNVNNWDKKNAEVLFYNETRRLNRLKNQYSIKEILAAIRSGYSQTPKG